MVRLPSVMVAGAPSSVPAWIHEAAVIVEILAVAIIAIGILWALGLSDRQADTAAGRTEADRLLRLHGPGFSLPRRGLCRGGLGFEDAVDHAIEHRLMATMDDKRQPSATVIRPRHTIESDKNGSVLRVP